MEPLRGNIGMVHRILGNKDNIFVNMKLREKIIFTFLVFGFFPMLIVSIVQLNMMTKDLQTRTVKETSISLDQMAQRVNERIFYYNQIVSRVVNDSKLRNLLSTSYNDLGEAIDLYHYVYNQNASIIEMNPEVYLSLYTMNDDLISTIIPNIIHINDLDEVLKHEHIPKYYINSYLRGTHTLPNKNNLLNKHKDEELYISFNQLIIEPHSYTRPMGMLTLSIREAELLELIPTNSPHTTALIIDDFGYIVSSTKRELLGKQIHDLMPKGERQDINLDVTYFDSQYGQMHFMTRELYSNWQVAIIISESVLNASTQRIQSAGMVIILLSTFLAITLVTIMSSITARRFQILINKFTATENGIPQPGKPIEGRDEIGLLDQHFRQMTSRLEVSIHNLYQVEIEKREAQLVALQSHINPHFLYNVLSDIGWMTQTHNPSEVRQIIEMLATYYRATHSGGRDIVTLREELEGLQAYVAIQQMRTRGRLKATIMIDHMLDEILLPKMTFQPIVENCFEHGIDETHHTISVLITSSIQSDAALIHIEDNGAGINESTLAMIREGSISGYGIQNVQMRLKLHFGDNYGLDIINLDQGGTRTSIRIPLSEE